MAEIDAISSYGNKLIREKGEVVTGNGFRGKITNLSAAFYLFSFLFFVLFFLSFLFLYNGIPILES